MPSAAVEAAFRTRLQAWGGTIVSPLFTSPPENVTSFAVIQFPLANGEKPVLGRRFFEEGAARIVVNITVETALPDALAIADTVAALFREVNLGGGVQTFVPSPPIINDSIASGNWVEYAVIVPYRYQFDG